MRLFKGLQKHNEIVNVNPNCSKALLGYYNVTLTAFLRAGYTLYFDDYNSRMVVVKN